jgi:hypothetical protein
VAALPPPIKERGGARNRLPGRAGGCSVLGC